MPTLNPKLYTVAWIAPLEIEATAALDIFDEVHTGEFPVTRGHDYIFSAGRVGGHNVVLATLAPGQTYGTGSAASLAAQVKMAFPNLWFGLLVGIAAGLPNHSLSPPRDIRLGDVLVALPIGESAGLIAYDLGKQVGDDFQLLRGGRALAMTEPVVRAAIGKIKLQGTRGINDMFLHYEKIQKANAEEGTFDDPGQDLDVLYERNEVIYRPHRAENKRTRVWYGTIGSGEKLMKDATRRNKLRDEYDLIGLEMEAAGTMNTLPVGVIRGVSDYADEDKNDLWQPYASAMAAAYALIILKTIQPKVDVLPFSVPFGRNENFVGRGEIITQLLKKVPPRNNESQCQRTAIEGLGGVGKTQVALEAAYSIREGHPDCSIFWVPALSMATFENAYREIGQALQIQGMEDEKANVKALVKAALERNQGSWLLIIDNVDDINLVLGTNDRPSISQWLPSSRNGSILFTTRNHAVTVRLDIQPDYILKVGEMSDEEATEMLHRGLRDDQLHDHESTKALLQYLANLPLAVKQACSYMAENETTTTKYLEYYRSSDEEQIDLLSQNFQDRNRYPEVDNPVATTWLISFNHISQINTIAVEYLKFICFLTEKDIPVSLLPKAQSQRKMDEAIGILKAYNFIIERGQDSFDIHRLVRLAARNWVKQEWSTWCTRAIQQLSRVCPWPTYDNHEIWVRYMPHTQTALEERKECDDGKATAQLLFNVGQGLSRLGHYGEAEEMMQQTLELHKKILGGSHPDTLASMNNLGEALSRQGKYREAEEMYRQTLELREKILGCSHPNILNSINNLAITLDQQGKYMEAEEMHRQTLELRENILGCSHPDTLNSMNNRGKALSRQGKYREAEEMHRQTLELKEKILGCSHPDTLSSMNNLAITLDQQGKYKEAEEMHRQTLELRENILGCSHPDTLNSINNLAVTLDQQGKYKEAEEMHRQTLELRENILGCSHPDTLSSINNLAEVLSSQGKYREAEEMHRQTLELRENILGCSHSDTLRTMNNLAVTLKQQEKYKEAEEMHRQMLGLGEKVLGHDYLAAISGLADIYYQQKRYTESEKLYKQAQQGYQQKLGVQHPDTLESMGHLALALQAQGKHEQAKAIYQQALPLMGKALGQEHPITIWMYENSASNSAIHRDASTISATVDKEEMVPGLSSMEELPVLPYFHADGSINSMTLRSRVISRGREQVEPSGRSPKRRKKQY